MGIFDRILNLTRGSLSSRGSRSDLDRAVADELADLEKRVPISPSRPATVRSVPRQVAAAKKSAPVEVVTKVPEAAPLEELPDGVDRVEHDGITKTL